MHPYRILLPVLIVVSQTIEACVDVLFAVDPQFERSVARAVNLASELADRDLRLLLTVQKDGRYLVTAPRNTAELIASLSNVTGNYSRFLSLITEEIRQRRDKTSLIVLLFSETDVSEPLKESWRSINSSQINVFRVGSAKTSSVILQHEKSFHDLIACSSKGKSIGSEIRRRPVNNNFVSNEEKQGSQSSMPSTNTKSHPVFRHLTTGIISSSSRPPTPTGPQGARVTSHRPLTSVLTTTRPFFRHSFGHRGSFVPLQATRSIASTTGLPATTIRVSPGCVADVLFLVDFSHGTGDNTKKYFDIAASTVGVLPIGEHAVRVGMVGYSGPGRATVLFQLSKHFNKDALIEEMFHTAMTGGTTRTADALKYAIKELQNVKHGSRKEAKKIIVVFTDGYSQDDPTPVANDARAAGIQLIAVGAEGRIQPNEHGLIDIAARKELVFISPTGHQIRDKILGRGCSL